MIENIKENALKGELLRGTSNTVAFPVLTDDEKRRLDRYKGVKNESNKEKN